MSDRPTPDTMLTEDGLLQFFDYRSTKAYMDEQAETIKRLRRALTLIAEGCTETDWLAAAAANEALSDTGDTHE